MRETFYCPISRFSFDAHHLLHRTIEEAALWPPDPLLFETTLYRTRLPYEDDGKPVSYEDAYRKQNRQSEAELQVEGKHHDRSSYGKSGWELIAHKKMSAVIYLCNFQLKYFFIFSKFVQEHNAGSKRRTATRIISSRRGRRA